MKIIDKQIEYDGFFKLYKVKLEEEGNVLERELFDTGHAVAALVFDTARQQYIFVKQYRLATNSKVLEVVAGLHPNPRESFEETACGRQQEETGYADGRITAIAS